MKLRKVMSIIGVCALAISLAACAKKEAPAETTAAATEAATKAAETETEKLIGMANPMVEITDSSEFEKQLGIKIDASKLHVTPKMFIIDGKVADVIIEETNVDGQPVEYRLRATKDAEGAPMMHGVYDELTDVGTVEMDFGGTKVKINQKENRDKKLDVHTWQLGDTYYSLVINNTHSQMQYAEVMDSIFAAIGINTSAQDTANEEPVGMANPMQEVTAEELSQKLGFSFRIPKGATDIKYFVYNNELGEARFKLDDIEFTARMKGTPVFTDISGMNYDWKIKEDGKVGERPAKFMRYIGDDGYIDVVLWFDEVPGMMYSLTAEAKDLDGFDIQAVAEEMFKPLQGEAENIPNIPDGTNRVGIHTDSVNVHDKEEEMIECETYTLVALDEATVKGLKKGDTIKLSQYGLQDIPVDSVKKQSNGNIEVNDFLAIEKNDKLGGYTMRGFDDDMVKYVDKQYIVTLNKDTKLVDEMSEIAGETPCKSVSEALNRYGFIEATIESKNGVASKVTIHYHP